MPGFQRGAPELLKTLKRHDAQRAAKKPQASSKADDDEHAAGPSGAGACVRACVAGAVRRGTPAWRLLRRRRGVKRARATDAPHSDAVALPGSLAALVEVGAYGGMQTEVEQLKRDRLLLLKEVMRLRETSAHTQEEVRSLSSRLAQTEAMQQQMLGFLQQHISPTLFNANSHLLQGRKRRHLLLAPRRGGDAPAPGAAGATLPPPLAFDDDDDAFMLGGGSGGGGGGGGSEGGAAACSPSGVFLHELPDEALPFNLLHPRSLAAPADALMPSYHALRPPPSLPDVMQLPLTGDADDADVADAFSWSDLLADLPPGAPPGAPPPAMAADASWASGGLTRMASEDIHRIVQDSMLDMQMDPPPARVAAA